MDGYRPSDGGLLAADYSHIADLSPVGQACGVVAAWCITTVGGIDEAAGEEGMGNNLQCADQSQQLRHARYVEARSR